MAKMDNGMLNGRPVFSISTAAHEALGEHTVRDVIESAEFTSAPGDPGGGYYEADLDGYLFDICRGTGEEEAGWTVMLSRQDAH